MPKGYIYFAVAFALLIELTNIRVKKNRKSKPIKLNKKSYNKAEHDKNEKAKDSHEVDPQKYPIGKFAPKESYSQHEVEASIARINALPNKLKDCVINFTDEQLKTPYRDGGWTVRQVIHHVADSHMNAYIRVKWTLTETEPTIKAYDEKAWANTPEVQLSPTISIDLLTDLHVKWVSLLNILTPEDLEKYFIHPETEKHVRIDRMIAMYAWHGEHHLAQITSLKEKKGWA